MPWMRRVGHIRFRLRVGILGASLLLLLPSMAAMVGILYKQNSDLAVHVAEDAMRRASTNISLVLEHKLATVSRGIELAAAFARSEAGHLRQPASWRPFYDELVSLPELYSLYFASAVDGGFLQMVRLGPEVKSFGPEGRPVPPGAHYAMRLIDAAPGEMAESYFYLAGWGDILRLERAATVAYDPYSRPWYKAALAEPGVANTGVYAFKSSGKPGITLSREIKTEEGQSLGVFAMDLTLDALSSFINQERVGRNGRVFILDRQGRLVGYPDTSRIIRGSGDNLEIVKAAEVDDPVVAGAVRLRDGGRGDHFRVPLGPDGKVFLVSFDPLPKVGNEVWTVGVIAAEDDFVGQIRLASLRILAVGSVFMLVLSLGVAQGARLLSRPLAALVEETKLIRRLDLGGEIRISSKIIEIGRLTDALAAMKVTLRSFGRYVPREVVRQIVAGDSGGGALGGRRQPLTVLFTDLAGFSKSSESMPPEQVLEELSGYFDVLVAALHAEGGTVDKFIGDGMMAFWNAPLPQSRHAVRGCQGMLMCREALAEQNRRRAGEGLPPLRTRMGLHTGTAIVGNVGASDRMQYTALGSMVNLASRLEGMCKYFGTSMLVSGSVVEEAREHFVFRPLGRVVAAGLTLPVELFELVGAAAGSPLAASAEDLIRCRAWEEALALYQAGDWPGAELAFARFLGTFGEDQAGILYLEQIWRFHNAPPGADWDGALHLAGK